MRQYRVLAWHEQCCRTSSDVEADLTIVTSDNFSLFRGRVTNRFSWLAPSNAQVFLVR
jgi:hypothetical protein